MMYGLLLAAGTSSRMGQPKQLLDWHGQPLVRHIAQQALASRLDGLMVVVGAAAEATRTALAGLDLTVVANPDYAAGQATSLRAGLGALPEGVAAVVVLLVDQPLVTPEVINHLITTFTQHQPDPPSAVIPRYRGQRGNPVLLAQTLFDELRALEGDVGARVVVQRHAAHVLWLDTDDPAVVTDVDTPDEYLTLKRKA